MFVQPLAYLMEVGVVLDDVRTLEVLGLARVTSALPPLEDARTVPVVCALHAGIRRGIDRWEHRVEVDLVRDRRVDGLRGANPDEADTGGFALVFVGGLRFCSGLPGCSCRAHGRCTRKWRGGRVLDDLHLRGRGARWDDGRRGRRRQKTSEGGEVGKRDGKTRRAESALWDDAGRVRRRRRRRDDGAGTLVRR